MYHPPHFRRVCILVPAFSLRRDGDLGIGDTASIREFCDWAAESGVGLVQLLPINETGPDVSPYNAISSVALDPLYIEFSPDVLPGLTSDDLHSVRAAMPAECFTGRLVKYPEVRSAKRRLLEAAWARFQSFSEDQRAEFENFCQTESDWLNDYTAFRFLMDKEGGRETWDTWPEEYNTPDKARGYLTSLAQSSPSATASSLGFYAFVQWVAFSQWKATRAYAETKGIRLMGDIPIGVSYYSSDVFFEPEQFDLSWSCGAPPETIFKDDLFVQKWGQNWGIPLYRWEDMQRDNFAWWRRRISKLTDIFHVFRIDHVLGFYRIYSFPWRPQLNGEFLNLTEEEASARTGGRLPHFIENADDTPEHKAANLAAGDTYLRMIMEAAKGSEVIAEDLGMVPDYVRPHLLQLGIPGFKIVHWESHPNGTVYKGHEYNECSFATYCTHDHEALKSMWERFRGEMAGVRGDADDQWKARRDLQLLSEFAGIHSPNGQYPHYQHGVQWQLLGSLLRSKSRYAAITITDLFGLEDRFNVPGVLDEQNWRTRLPWTTATMRTDPALLAETHTLRCIASETGRLP